MFENVRADMRQYEDLGPWYLQLGFWITTTYRFGAWAHARKTGPLRSALMATHLAMCAPWAFFRGVYLPPRAKIGAGLRLPHAQNILIGAECEIGENCSIFHDVTLGRGGGMPGPPKIGNNVRLFAGAKVLGNVVVGDNSEVSANAVVSRDVPPSSVVMGPPSRAVPKETILATQKDLVQPKGRP